MLFNTKDSSTILGAITQSHQNKVDVASYKTVYDTISQSTDPTAIFKNMQVDTAKEMSDKVKNDLIDIQQKIKAGQMTAEQGLTKINGLMNQSVEKGTKLGTTFANIGKTLLNGFASGALSAVITWVLGKVIEIADKLIITKKEAEGLAQTFRDSFSSMQTDQKKVSTEIQGLNQEFEELSKGVNSLGQNVSLSEEEFERYHEITSIIAENMPNLVTGYDEQGNAIIRLTDNVRSLSEAYKEARQEQAYNLYNQEDDKGQSVIKGVYKNAQNISDGIFGDFDLESTLNMYKELASMDVNSLEKAAKDTSKYFGSREYLAQYVLGEAGAGGNTDELNTDDFKKVHAQLVSQYRDYQNEIKMAAKDVREAGITYAEGLEDFWDNLNEKQISAFENYVNTFDFDFLKENDLLDEEEMKTYISGLIDTFDKLTEKDLQQIDLRLNLSTQFNSGEISAAEYYQKLQELNNYLNGIPDGEVKKIISVLFNLSVNDENKIDKRVEYLKQLIGDNWDDAYLDKVTEKELDLIMNIEPRYKESDNFDERGFQKYDYSYDEKGNRVKLEPELDPYSWDEISEQISDEVNPVEVELKASDAVDAMADAKTAITSLEPLYEQTVTKAVKDGLATGFADPAALMSIRTAFNKFSEDLENKGDVQGANTINKQLQDFETTLLEFPGDSDKAQEAMNSLITTYLDHSNVIKSLTKDRAKWAEEQLKAMDIENAEEFVQTRLNKTYKATRQNLINLSKTVEQYADALEKSDKTAADFSPMNGQFKEVTAQVANLIGQYDRQTGELVSPADIDGQFMADNWGLVEDAIHGVDGAVDQLYTKLAMTNAEQIYIDAGIDLSEYEGDMTVLQELIDYASQQDITVDALLNDADYMSKLTAFVSSSKNAANAANAAFATIGFQMKYNSTPKKYRVPKLKDTKINSAQDYKDKLIGYDYVEFDEVSLDVKTTGKGTPGSSANYTPSGDKNSPGGTPGGNNNSGGDNDKLNEDSKNTFDWIEIKLKRLDEAIARLDKTTNDVYSSWTKRNKSLDEEIDKTIEKVELQEKAYKRYNKNFENLKLSDIETKPDKKNYKDNAKQYQKDIDDWNEAETKWASGKYQDLIKNGKIGKNDIQTIKNKYLAALINEGLSRYEKAVTAGDTVQETQLKLKDLYKQEFDLIVEEFDDMLQKIEDKVAKVNEAMNLNNERGRFYFGKGNDQANNAQSKYYKNNRKNIKALEKEELDRQKKLEDKRTKLIAQRDKQRKLNEKRGGVDKDSKALADYDKQIRDTELEIKKSNTELAKLNNDTRESFIQEFEDIGTDYSNAVDLLQHKLDMVEESKNQISENGRWIVKDYYNKTISKIKERSKIESEEAKKLDKQYDKQAAKLDKMVKRGRKRGGVDMYDEDWYKMVNDLNELDKKREELKTNAIKSINEIREVHKQKFNDICTDFDNYIARLQNGRNIISGLIERTQTKGYWVDASYYKEDKKIIAAQKAQREKERAKLIAEINDKVKLGRKNGGFDYGDEDWYEEYQKIADINQEIITLDNNIIKIDNDIRQLNWDKFDYLEKRIQEISSEAAFLQGLLSSEKDMDEYGYYNDRGWAESAMIQAQYQAAQARKKEFQKERDELEAEMNKNNGAGWNDKNMVERWNSLTSSIREATQAENQFANANKELVSKSINQHLSKLKELMNEYKETLQSAKDLYDWQKNVEDQGKNISNLRKQLTAYESDDSEAARKRRIELRQQLNEAERQLQESEMDHYISETGKILDNLYEDYEDVLTSNLESISTLMTKQMSENEAHTQQIAKGLTEIKDQFGIDIDNFNPLTDESDPSSLASKLKAIHDAMTKAVTDMQNTAENGAKDDVEYNTKQIIVNPDGTLSVKDYGTTGGKKNNTGGGTSGGTGGKKNNNKSADKIDKEVEKIINRDISKEVEKNATAAQKSLPKTSSKNNINNQKGAIAKKINEKNKELQIQSDYLNSYSYELSKLYAIKKKTPRDLDYINRYETLSSSASQNIAIIKNEIARLQEEMAGLSSLPYYAGGTKSVKRKEMGWTQDAGSELIYRTTDGAILTPLNQGDMVFTHEMSQRLWEIAKDGIVPVSGTTSVPNIPGATLQNLSNNNQIEIVLPNVQDYNDFKHELQNDNKFEKFIQEITVGRLNGNNSLNKRKY